MKHRAGFVLFSLAMAITGTAILFTVHDNIPVEYAAVVLVAMGTFSALPISICWYVMNIHGDYQRAVGSAGMISFGNIGGIVATWSFLATDAPLYHTGYSVVMTGLCLMAGTSVIYAAICFGQNRMAKSSTAAGSEKKKLLL